MYSQSKFRPSSCGPIVRPSCSGSHPRRKARFCREPCRRGFREYHNRSVVPRYFCQQSCRPRYPGIAASSLTERSWVRGPEFLRTHDWPFQAFSRSLRYSSEPPTLPTDDVPVHSLAANATPVGSVINWDRFSSYNKFVLVVAYVLRLLPKHKHFRTAN